MTIDIDAVRGQLDEERARLVHQLDELGASENGDLRKDLDFGEGFADAAAITAKRTEVLGLVETIKAHLDSVDEAIGRIAEGKYGSCRRCGADISAARLEARPASLLCVDCASK